ncbi:MAG: carbonic anhydrase family protein [Sulfuritalea sp.]|nr:carbonic anhydrase family protein [Sulfuritalea sp.]
MSVSSRSTVAVLMALFATAVADVARAQAGDAAAQRPRMFDVPAIDKAKAEDPFKNAPPPAAPRPAPPAAAPRAQPAPPAPAPRPVLKMPELAAAQELTRQQRERMLATSGPQRAAPQRRVEPSPEPDFTGVQWGYAGPGAPENWHRITPAYALCAAGKRQAPIDIRSGIRVDLETIRFDYRPTRFRITDTGHTLRVDVAEGNSITVMGRGWQLEHLVFRRPAEERVHGKTYEMSVQLVHRDLAGHLAIVAVLVERGPEHPLIQALWNHMPLDKGLSVEPPGVAIDLAQLLPERRDYYTYMGSLTTPPCTENVLWMVLKEPIPVSPEQIGIFARLYPHNARPVQPPHGRLIKESR